MTLEKAPLAALTPPPSVTLRARYHARESVSLPAFLGGTMHGALGHAIEAVGGSADGILGRRTAPDDAPAFVRASPPSACVMIPPPPGRARTLHAGEALELAVLLVAPDAPRIGVVLAALEKLGTRGLGRGRGRLALDRVVDGSGRLVWKGGQVVEAPAPDVGVRASGVGPWTVRAHTPLHLVRAGGLVACPTAADLVLAAARRLVGLAWTYGEPVEAELQELKRETSADLAGGVAGDWSQVRGERWSERQRRRHPVEGVMGVLAMPPRIERYLPLITRALRFGVGKGTALGLGQLELIVAP